MSFPTDTGLTGCEGMQLMLLVCLRMYHCALGVRQIRYVTSNLEVLSVGELL